MKYIINKYVDADNLEEALRKSKNAPIHEIFIHNDSWKEQGYNLKTPKGKKMGFEDAGKKTTKPN